MRLGRRFFPQTLSLALVALAAGPTRAGDDPRVVRVTGFGAEPGSRRNAVAAVARAEKKTDVPGGVGVFRFTPDGKRLVLTAEVWPECGANAACNRKKDETVEKGKMKAYVADRLLFRHWDAWEDGKRTHLLVFDLANPQGSPRDLTPGDCDSPAFVVGGGTDFDVSPDGRELVFTSNRDA
jgi:dipeptidyl aminopeptidase/acylaminoacyl peptidase